MFLERKLYSRLLDWKVSERRKPLIIRGARQVGKSTLIRAFSKESINHFFILPRPNHCIEKYTFSSSDSIMCSMLLFIKSVSL